MGYYVSPQPLPTQQPVTTTAPPVPTNQTLAPDLAAQIQKILQQYQNNPYIAQLGQVAGQLGSYNPLPTLPPEVMAALAQMSQAQNTSFDLQARNAQDSLLTRLFSQYGQQGPGSTVVEDPSGRLALELAAGRAQLSADDAQRLIQLQQYFGTQGLQGLLGQANVLGSAAGLQQNQLQSILAPILAQYQTQAGFQANSLLGQQQYGYNSALAGQQFGYQQQLGNQQFGQQLISQAFDFLLKNGVNPQIAGSLTTRLPQIMSQIGVPSSMTLPFLSNLIRVDPTLQHIQNIQNQSNLLFLQDQYRKMLQSMQNQSSPFGANTGANYGY